MKKSLFNKQSCLYHILQAVLLVLSLTLECYCSLDNGDSISKPSPNLDDGSETHQYKVTDEHKDNLLNDGNGGVLGAGKLLKLSGDSATSSDISDYIDKHGILLSTKLSDTVEQNQEENNDINQKYEFPPSNDILPAGNFEQHISPKSKRSSRDFSLGFKRKWSGFNTWGKRNVGGLTIDHERLARNSESAKWEDKEDKGDADLLSSNHLINGQEKMAINNFVENDKNKRWGKDSFNSWGKRSDPEGISKQWGKDAFNSWGKRSDPAEGINDLSALDKRSQEKLFKILTNKKTYKKFGNTAMISWWKPGEDYLVNKMVEKKWKNNFDPWGKRSGINAKRWAKNNFNSWGKRSNDDKKRWTQNDFDAWGKRSDDELNLEKKWSKSGFNSWGKRSDNELEESDQEKRWAKSDFNSWGKRSHQDDKRWTKSGFNTWGKRSNINDDKRWSKSGFNSWGKRSDEDDTLSKDKKWAKNDFDSWGKRSIADEGLDEDKKKWAKSGFNSWGKRSDDDTIDVDKKWAKSGFNSWGKRSSDEKLAEDKKWGKSSFNSWGKRSSDDLLEKDKKWGKSGFNSWGKRARDDSLDKEKKWAKSDFNSWGKRSDEGSELHEEKKWTKSGFNSWGKRSDSDEGINEEKKWAKSGFNSWGKRSNQDDEKKWSKSGFNSWGKRNGNDQEKKWGKNSFNSWGKRDSVGEKRWGKDSFNSWGKRSIEENSDQSSNSWYNDVNSKGNENGKPNNWGMLLRSDTISPDKKWGKQGFNTWGKRTVEISDQNNNEMTFNADNVISSHRDKRNIESYNQNDIIPYDTKQSVRKRRWNNQLHIWGKRTNFPFFGGPKRGWKANEMKVWGKRSWKGNGGMNAWGKRDNSLQNDIVDILRKEQINNKEMFK